MVQPITAFLVVLFVLAPAATASEDPSPPGPPLALAAVTQIDPLTSEPYVLLSWQPPLDDGGAPITEYRIYRASGPSATSTLLGVSEDVSFADTTVTSSPDLVETYWYAVAAVNIEGEGAPSLASPTVTPTREMGPDCVEMGSGIPPFPITVHPSCLWPDPCLGSPLHPILIRCEDG